MTLAEEVQVGVALALTSVATVGEAVEAAV
jgi:hypothetical protein